jgi:NADPH:quinone reductase-like Zn-dependent oxidoreductase
MPQMTAAVHDRYGPPDVLRLDRVPRPEPGAGALSVRVAASSVTTADWRLRASAFPGILWLPGRLMTGLVRPKNRVLGTEFAGTVAALGPGAAGFAPGDRVFGFCGHGGNADYLTVAADGPVVATPPALSDRAAAALPFGAISALVFLRDVARLGPGQSVLIVGGSGGVGVYAIQIARHLGAEVTAVASAANLELMRDLGAAHVVDYRAEDVTRGAIGGSMSCSIRSGRWALPTRAGC